MKTTIHLAIGVVFTCLALRADGGVVRLRRASGPFLVTVFMASEPLRVGSIDTSVLVQDPETGTVIFDTTVNLSIRPISAGTSFLTQATRGRARNKLLQAAALYFPASGWWDVQVVVYRGREEAVFATKLFISTAATRLIAIWPFLILPPFAVGLFVIHQVLRHSAGITPAHR